MLSIHKLSAGNANYYVELAQEDYYVKGGEPPGTWAGKGAERLRLEGLVHGEQFLALFRGFSPDGQQPLVQNAGQGGGYHRRCPGWDLTFSAPKTVSVLWAMAPADLRVKIQEAHEQAVRNALHWMEAFAGETRRGQGGKIREQAGLCFALFEHGTNRNQEPQLHTHAICFNLAFRQDGTTGSVRSNQLYEFKLATGALYRADFANTLHRGMGLESERVRNWFELRGVDRGLVEFFSSRRQEVLKSCLTQGAYGPKQAEAAALATRRTKEPIPREKLFREWQQVGAERGWGQREAVQLLSHSAQRIPQQQSQQGAEQALDQLTREVKTDQPFASNLKRAALNGQVQGLTADQIATAVFNACHINKPNQTQQQDQQRTEQQALHRGQEPAPSEPSRAVVQKTERTSNERPAGQRLKSGRTNATGTSRPGRRQRVRRVKLDTPRIGKLTWKAESRFASLEVRRKQLFPDAPGWSGAGKCKWR